MTAAVTEIAPHVYRISTFAPDFGIQFNQFLVVDDEPFLMHTGMKKMFAEHSRCRRLGARPEPRCAGSGSATSSPTSAAR